MVWELKVEFSGDVRLSADLGRLRCKCGYGGFLSVGLGARKNSKKLETSATVRSEGCREIKNQEAPESRKSCGAVRGLVNLFPGFSEFQDFIYAASCLLFWAEFSSNVFLVLFFPFAFELV